MKSNDATKRSCGNCCCYECGECLNGLGYVTADCVCDQHKTHEEDKLDDAAFARFMFAAVGGRGGAKNEA